MKKLHDKLLQNNQIATKSEEIIKIKYIDSIRIIATMHKMIKFAKVYKIHEPWDETDKHI